MGLSLSDLLKRMLEMNGSDLHITTIRRHRFVCTGTSRRSICRR
jgi:hypothetical protein